MFSLPRDTVDVPIPAGPPARLWGRVYRGKINALFTSNRNRAGPVARQDDQTRGYNAPQGDPRRALRPRHQVLRRGQLRRLQAGRRRARRGTINVQVPVVDDRYPAARGASRGSTSRPGIQHMTGAEALVYARSRHGSNDFDRGAASSGSCSSLREQADPQA